jgi:two-component system response regulator MprA
VLLRFADLTLELTTRRVRRGRRAIELTPIEFALLELLLRHPERVLQRSFIFTRVWGYDFGVTSNALTVCIANLRQKLEGGGEPRLVHTVRGIGYVLREP